MCRRRWGSSTPDSSRWAPPASAWWPVVADEDTVRELCALIDRPVNVLASPDVSVNTLADWGVRRVSTGSLPYRAAMAAAAQVALALRDGGPIPAATPYGQMQSRLLAYHRR
jgi:2-methylisocitrate lyase-like PEP mutase family enzyme